MEWEDALDALKERLEEVSGIAFVLDWDPSFTSKTSLAPYLEDVGGGVERVNIWYLTRDQILSERGGSATRIPLNWHRYTDLYILDGYYSYSGRDSLIAFNNLVELVRIKFDTEITLGSGTDLDWVAGPLSRCDIDYRIFAEMTCHHCRGTIPVVRCGPTEYEES